MNYYGGGLYDDGDGNALRLYDQRKQGLPSRWGRRE